MSELTLEIVEGPGAGRQVALGGPLVVGRAPDADVVLDDGQVSRHHARVSPTAHGAVVEDLGSSNGTFINHAELHAPARLDVGDDLLIGVTLIELRSPAQVASQPSAVRAVPPALAAPERQPTYVTPPDAGGAQGGAPPPAAPDLDRLLDARTRFQARTAPLAIFVLAALIVAIYFAVR